MTNSRTVLKSLVGVSALAAAGVSLPGIAFAAELETLKNNGVMRIAMSVASPPCNFIH